MIQFNNQNDWKIIQYQGHSIKAVYSNLGKVWPSVEPPFGGKFKATYSAGQTYTKYCDGDTELSLSETQPSGYEYSAMTEAIIGNCVSSIGGGAFANCSSLTSVTIPDSVTSIGGAAFGGCTSLTSITIPYGVTSIGAGTFQNCHSLTGVTIPSGVTTIGFAAFEYCTALTSITIPNSVTTIGVGAFQNCSGLSSITVNATTPPTLDSGVFYNTNNCPIYVPCESVEAYKTAWSGYASRIQCVPQPFGGKFKLTLNDSTIITADCSSSNVVTSVEVSSQYSGTVVSAEIGNCCNTIGDGAFEFCTSLASVTIPNSVTIIDKYSFNRCSGLTSVTLPNSVTSIGEAAFHNCYGLTNIVIPDSVTSISDSTFGFCTGLTSIEIPDSVTTIGVSAFAQCRSLTDITIPNSVTSIGGSAFYNCSGLTSITCNATTPPSLGYHTFDDTNNCPIYVPSGSVEAYKAASDWSTYADRIQAIQ